MLAEALICMALTGCYTTEKVSVQPDPSAVYADGKRDDGTGGRAKVLRNTIFIDRTAQDQKSIGLPINPICLRPNTEGVRGNFEQLDKAQMLVALFPSDRRNWTTPILIRNHSTLDPQQVLESRVFSVDLASIPDGRYNILICANEATCRLPAGIKSEGLTDGLGINLRSPSTKKYRFLEKDGIFGNQPFKDFIQNALEKSLDLVGFGANIWIEQGRLVWPKDPAAIWNGRMVPGTSSKKRMEFTDERASIPVVHLSYRPPSPRAPSGFCFPELDVLVIDLENRGLEMSQPGQGITVDLDRDESLEKVSWPVKSGTGFLVIDSKKSGSFAGISDLVADFSTDSGAGRAQNAFEVLRKFDENHDGSINSSDSWFPFIGIWIDKNYDGKLDKAEALSLKESKIESISLRTAEISESDDVGNYSLFRSIAKRKDNDQNLLVYSLRMMVNTARKAKN
jgi:hypothetical protein